MEQTIQPVESLNEAQEKVFEVKETDDKGAERRIGVASEGIVDYIHAARNTAQQYFELYTQTKNEVDTLEELVLQIKNYIKSSNLLTIKWYEFKKLVTAVKTIIKMIDSYFDIKKEQKQAKKQTEDVTVNQPAV